MKNPYILYIDGMEIPVTPAKIRDKRDSQNEFYDLINGETYTVKRKSALKTFPFSFFIFSNPHPGVSTFIPQQTIIKKLEDLVKERKEFEFAVIRTPSDPSLRNSTCKFVTLEDWEIEEDSKYGTNAIINLELKEYQPLKTIKLKDVDGTSEKRQVTENVQTEGANAKKEIGIDVLCF